MKIIDLSHTLESGMPVYPGDETPNIQKSATHEKDSVQVTRLGISTHTGTHLDTPRHFVANDCTTDKMDLNKFYGKAVVIDCRDFGGQQQIPLSHIEKYKTKLESADFALIYTAWHHHWGTNKYFDHFPVLSVEANAFLVCCNLKGIGIDSSSIDSMDSTNYPNHNLVLGKGIIIIENLTNLDQLIDTDFQFAAFPLKIKEGDGSPVRAVAFVGN